MRPLKVTLQAFASYGKRTEIDLQKPNQNLFLITGDTGSGKSTIFDAIVFALYGEASSENNKKSGMELQSQFVEYDSKPFVELVFSETEGDEEVIYTVCRSPRHKRPKRGGGYKEDGESVELIMPSGLPYDGKIKETNEKLESIVGLTKAQFMQVAMIAQGEFMALVRSDSNTRKEIFRKLFNTEKYQKIVDTLYDRCRSGMAELAQMKTVFKTELAHVEIPEDYEQAELMEGQKHAILSSDQFSVTTMEAFLEGLESLCQDLYKDVKAAEEIWKKAAEKRDGAYAIVNKATSLASAYTQLEQADAVLEACKAQEEAVIKAREMSQKIEASYELKAAWDRYEDVRILLEELKQKLKAEQEGLPELIRKYELALAKEAAASKARDEELAVYTTVEAGVNQALEKMKQQKLAGKALQQAKEDCGQAKDQVEKVKKTLSELEDSLAVQRKEEGELAQTGEALAQCQSKLNTLADYLIDVSHVKSIAVSCKEKQERFTAAKEAYLSASDDYKKQQASYEAEQEAYYDAQAGILARELTEGQPCPVCGSIDHPHPHTLSQSVQVKTREELNALSQKVDQLRSLMEEKSGLAKAANAALEEEKKHGSAMLAELRSRVVSLLPDLKKDSTFPEIEKNLKDLKKQLMLEEKNLKKQKERLDQVRLSIGNGEKKQTELKQQESTVQEALIKAKEVLASRETALNALMEGLEYESEAQAKSVLKAAEEKRKVFEQAYQDAADGLKKEKSRKEAAETLIGQYKKQIPGQEANCVNRKGAYELLQDEKQISEEVWKQITADRARSDAEELRSFVSAYVEKKAGAEGMKTASLESIQGQPRPDLVQLKEIAGAAEEEQQKCRRQVEHLSSLHKNNSKTLRRLKPMLEERNAAATEYERANYLYRRLSGKMSGSRMDLETFVQRYYLERILQAANVRFSRMSAGQFELRMYDLEKAGEGKNRGLDLMVYSTVTGKEREVKSLSGGETFMAALSLAMGIADQIQAGSASVNLDIMFIDEGFGSLSDEVRNQAVRVLQQMAEGSKLIGIISHVTELKHQIDDQLIITKDEEGSHCRWQIS